MKDCKSWRVWVQVQILVLESITNLYLLFTICNKQLKPLEHCSSDSNVFLKNFKVFYMINSIECSTEIKRVTTVGVYLLKDLNMSSRVMNRSILVE